ncbi:MAG: purine-nucleoside phosphorylase [Bacteroidales bacterium]|nr:purine-nucleoside phosphorylase [Bacteroidales bacterium]
MYDKINQTAEYLKSQIDELPQIGVILGSGLGNFAEGMNIARRISYKSIPNFPLSTVKGHKGELLFGTMANKQIVCMQGRFHYYEGYSMQQVTFPVRVMKALGVRVLIVTNASGAVNPEFETGDIMIIKDHINTMPNPLIGPNDERLGVRFPPMSTIYDKQLRDKAKTIARELGITLREGVYIGTTGPSFETPAEYKYFRTIGADTVGMSTVPEVIVASHSGMRVFGMSVISNVFREDNQQDCTHEEVLEGVAKAGNKMSRIVERLIAQTL